MKLVDQICESFERNQYTLGVFIDLPKAFDTISHSVLIKKLQMYGIRGVNLAWFRSYLANRKQYITSGHDLKTHSEHSLWSPTGLNIKTVAFFIYIDDLPNSSVFLIL